MTDIPIAHLLVFAGDEERERYQSPERTDAERRKLEAELREVYASIPCPTEEELRQFMGENNWLETQRNPSARDLSRAQWKGFRKADARRRLAESKRQSEPNTETLGGSHEMWFGHFYISHLDRKDRDRIKRGDFTPQEIEMLAKGESPWAWHKPFPAGLEPPASLPPLEEWRQKVVEQFSPLAEKVRRAAEDATKTPPRTTPEATRTVENETPELPDDLREILGIHRTGKEKRDAELLQFMPPQLRAEYDKADAKRRAVLWEINERNFEAAKEREDQRLRQYQQKTEKTLDLLHRLREEPSKAHLLPPEDASMDDLHKWHDDMSKPARNIPFASPSKEWLRRDRINRAIQSGGRPDPEDLAEEAAEEREYQRKVTETFRKKELELYGWEAFPSPDEDVSLITGKPRKNIWLEVPPADDASDPNKGTKKNMTGPITPPSQLNVFLCHSSGDKAAVRALHQRLIEDGVRPWLDEEDLLPGQDWNMEIRRAVRNSHVVIVCLSKNSINKAGYVQKEIREALDVADEQPERTIFIIPLRLEECDVPDRLRRWHWVDYFDANAHARLMRALKSRAEKLGISLASTSRVLGVPHHASRQEQSPTDVFSRPLPPSSKNAAKRLNDALARSQRAQAKASSEQDLVGRFAASARLKGPEEFQRMERIFQDRASDFNKDPHKPDTVPDISYDSRRHLLDGKKYGVSIDILIGQVYELRVFVGLHPDAAQFMAELPDVEVTRWRFGASEDESGFFWHEINQDARFSSEQVVDASIDTLTDLLAAEM